MSVVYAELEIRPHCSNYTLYTNKMPPRAIIPAAIVTAPTPERQNFVHSSYPHDHPQQGRQPGPSRVSYGSTQSARTSPGSHKGKEPAVDFEERYEVESCDSDDGDDMEPLVDSMCMSTTRGVVKLTISDLETHVKTVPSCTSYHSHILHFARASCHSCLVSLP
jgi:hypothetical protein